MLEHLAGEEGIASSELIRDLRTLCGLSREQIAGIRDVIGVFPKEPSEDLPSKELLSKLQALPMDPEKLSSVVQVVLFLWQKWARLHLTKADILSDLSGLKMGDGALANLAPLLDEMERRLEIIQHQQAEGSALKTGTPWIDSTLCVIDARAVFKSQKHDADKGPEQPYFQLDHFLPVVILEMVSELNEEKRTNAYVLTEKTLAQLCDILSRAKTRLAVLKDNLDKCRDGTGQ